jgi:hypothetical protein
VAYKPPAAVQGACNAIISECTSTISCSTPASLKMASHATLLNSSLHSYKITNMPRMLLLWLMHRAC